MMPSRQDYAARLCAAGATAALALSMLERVRRRHAAAREATGLIAQLKALNSTAALVVTNARGDAFAAKALATYVRRTCGSSTGLALADARRLIKHCTSTTPPKAHAFAPSGDAKRLIHVLVRGGVDPQLLHDRFPRIKGAYAQQALDYGPNSRYGDRWKISCYLVVLEKWKPKIMPHLPMVEALSDVVQLCCRGFENWYAERFSRTRHASVMNAFVTRYRPRPDESELKRHIDGANVDGSVILALPTDEPFEGGALKVWDPKSTLHEYAMAPGDCIFLDTRVWHQGCAISSGARYALVLFLRLDKKLPYA